MSPRNSRRVREINPVDGKNLGWLGFVEQVIFSEGVREDDSGDNDDDDDKMAFVISLTDR